MQLNCSRQLVKLLETGIKRCEQSLDSYHEMFIIGLVLDSPQFQLTKLVKHVQEATNATIDTSKLLDLPGRKYELLCKGH